jgi:hypothetical protein
MLVKYCCITPLFKRKMACSPKDVYDLAHDVLNEKFGILIADDGKELSAEYMTMADVNCFEPCKAAELRANAKKNRYLNVLPFDFNRVKLNGKGDYINASLLEVDLLCDACALLHFAQGRACTCRAHPGQNQAGATSLRRVHWVTPPQTSGKWSKIPSVPR